MKAKYLFVFLLISLLTFHSCRKTERDLDTTMIMVEENGFAEKVFADVYKQVHQVAIEDTRVNNVTITSISNPLLACMDSLYFGATNGDFPKTLILDYGSNKDACSDDKVRLGLIRAKFSSYYFDSLSTVTITFSYFKVDDVKVSGSITIKNKGKNKSGNTVFEYKVLDGVLDGDSIFTEYDCSRNFEWTSGSSSFAVSDDIFTISGKANGRTTKGSAFDVTMVKNQTYETSCEWFTSGAVSIAPENLGTREVDYGSSCDNKVTVTLNSSTYDVELD